MRGIALGLFLLAGCAGAAPVREPAVLDVDGRALHPLAVDDALLHVIVFTTVDCPIANSYAPELAGIAAAHADDPVRFFLVHVDPDVDAEGAREHAVEYGLPGTIALDPTMAFARAVGATVTPEAFVVGRDGEIAYRGRIDDTWGDVGAKRARTGRHDLRLAIAAVLDGEAVEEPRTVAVGCPIPFELAPGGAHAR